MEQEAWDGWEGHMGFDFSLNILSLEYLSKLKVEMSIRLIEKAKYMGLDVWGELILWV